MLWFWRMPLNSTLASPPTGVLTSPEDMPPAPMALDAPGVRAASWYMLRPADGDLRNLLAGDDVALLAGVGLNADGVGFDRDRFLRAAELHLEVDTGAITDLKDDALLFGDFEAGGFGFGVVVTDFEFGQNVLAGVAGDSGVYEASFEVGESDFNVGNGGAGGIA